jgi:hypothetical protein
MVYEDLAKELKKNIQIMTNTFEGNNLQVLNVSCRPTSSTSAHLDVYVELASIKGSKISTNVDIKINLYDSDGELLYCESQALFSCDFRGYDTLKILCYDDNTLNNATKGRLYAVRNA